MSNLLASGLSLYNSVKPVIGHVQAMSSSDPSSLPPSSTNDRESGWGWTPWRRSNQMKRWRPLQLKPTDDIKDTLQDSHLHYFMQFYQRLIDTTGSTEEATVSMEDAMTAYTNDPNLTLNLFKLFMGEYEKEAQDTTEWVPRQPAVDLKTKSGRLIHRGASQRQIIASQAFDEALGSRESRKIVTRLSRDGDTPGPISNPNPGSAQHVYLCMVDLSKGFAREMVSTKTKPGETCPITGVWHASIIFGDYEFQFGSAITCTRVIDATGKVSRFHTIDELLDNRFDDLVQQSDGTRTRIFHAYDFGESRVSLAACLTYVKAMSYDRFFAGAYDAFTNNCIDFATDLLYHLTGGLMPIEYARQVGIFKAMEGGVGFIVNLVNLGFKRTMTDSIFLTSNRIQSSMQDMFGQVIEALKKWVSLRPKKANESQVLITINPGYDGLTDHQRTAAALSSIMVPYSTFELPPEVSNNWNKMLIRYQKVNLSEVEREEEERIRSISYSIVTSIESVDDDDEPKTLKSQEVD